MSGIFENLEMFDEGDKVATRQALAAANKRFNDQFGEFLRQASSKSEFEKRFALVEGDINNMVNDVAYEYEGDAQKIAKAIKKAALATHVAKRPEHLEAQDEVQIADEHSQVSPWLKKQIQDEDQEDGGNLRNKEAASEMCEACECEPCECETSHKSSIHPNQLSYAARRLAEINSQPIAFAAPLAETPGYGGDIEGQLENAPSAVGTGKEAGIINAFVESRYPETRDMNDIEKDRYFGATPTGDLLKGIHPTRFAARTASVVHTAAAHKVEKKGDKFYVTEDGGEKAAGPFDSKSKAKARAAELNDLENLEKVASHVLALTGRRPIVALDAGSMGQLAEMLPMAGPIGMAGQLLGQGAESGALGHLTNPIDGAKDNLGQAAGNAKDFLGDALTLNFGDAIGDAVKGVGNVAESVPVVGPALEAIFGSTAVLPHKQAFDVFDTLTQGVGELANGAGQLAEGTWDSTFPGMAWNAAGDVARGKDPSEALTQGGKEILNGAGQLAEGTWDSSTPGMIWNMGIQHGKEDQKKPADPAASADQKPAPHTPPAAGGGAAPWNPFSHDQSTYGVGDSGKQVEQIQQHLINGGYMGKGADDGQFGANTEAALKKFQQDKGLTSDGTFGNQTLKAFQGQAGEKAAPNVAPGVLSSTHVAENMFDGRKRTPEQEAAKWNNPFTGKPITDDPMATGPAPHVPVTSELPNLPGKPLPGNSVTTPGGLGDKNPFAGLGGQTLQFGSQGNDVKKIQENLNQLNPGADIKVDGQFGAATQQALQDYQKTNNLTVDGIAGAQTAGSMINNINDRSVYAQPKPGEITKAQGDMPNQPKLPATTTPGKPAPFNSNPTAIQPLQPTAASTDTGDSTEGRESLPKGNEDAHDGPSPKMDKKKWVPNATNPKGNLKPIETEGENSPHPTRQMDIKQKPDYQNDDPWEHDNNVWEREELPTATKDEAGFEGTRNIEQLPTKTFPDKGQTDPVTRQALAFLQKMAIFKDERSILEKHVPENWEPWDGFWGAMADAKTRGVSDEEVHDLWLSSWRVSQDPEVLEQIGITPWRSEHEETNEALTEKFGPHSEEDHGPAGHDHEEDEHEHEEFPETDDEIEEIIERGDKDGDRTEVSHEEDMDDLELLDDDELERLMQEDEDDDDWL